MFGIVQAIESVPHGGVPEVGELLRARGVGDRDRKHGVSFLEMVRGAKGGRADEAHARHGSLKTMRGGTVVEEGVRAANGTMRPPRSDGTTEQRRRSEVRGRVDSLAVGPLREVTTLAGVEEASVGATSPTPESSGATGIAQGDRAAEQERPREDTGKVGRRHRVSFRRDRAKSSGLNGVRVCVCSDVGSGVRGHGVRGHGVSCFRSSSWRFDRRPSESGFRSTRRSPFGRAGGRRISTRSPTTVGMSVRSELTRGLPLKQGRRSSGFDPARLL